ncbi:MAG: Rrf2 family transcriptional regulator [Burkholderiaceae bacterium]|nr:Rrf2 family transcriptional regulator [Burkholderiaceae bacterium]
MQIATKGRLAVTAMLDLALRCEQGPVTLSAIGARQQVSLSYLELLFARLRRQGLVRSTRGPGGGYGLARKAAGITVADIVRAVDEGGPPCTRAAKPPSGEGLKDQVINSDWCADLERVMTQYLASVSLQDLVDGPPRLGHAPEPAPISSVVARGMAPQRRRVVTAANSVFAAARQLTL